MALRKTIEVDGKVIFQTNFGTIESDTQPMSFLPYIKVTSVNGNKTQINAIVNFKCENTEWNNSYQVPVSVALGSDNYIAQTYQYLKTLPEFEGAEDC